MKHNISEILDVKILKASREECKINLKQVSERTLELDFRILEYEDGFSAQIIYHSIQPLEILVKGSMVGVKTIYNGIPFSISRFIKHNWIMVTIGFIGLFGAYYFYRESTTKQEKWLVIIGALMTFIFFSWLTLSMYFGDYDHPASKDRNYIGLTKRVPSTIVPN